MSIYVGIIVLEELLNKQRYDQTIKELSLFLKTHSAEIDLQIDDKFVSFKPIDSLSEINFPQNSTYFRTTYFRISIENQSDDIYLKRFCELVWECCCIFKENFPSRIELFQENLDQYINIDEVSLNQELLRRQINGLLNKLSLQEKLKKDEIQDIFSVLENSITLQNLKGLKACLELLESELCAPCLLQQVSQKEIDLLESIDNDEGVIKQNFDSELLLKEYQDIRQCCQSILCKILRVKNQLSDNQNNAGAHQQNSIIQQLKKFEVVNYNQPTFKHSYIFQLRETSDIERVTFILDTLMSKNLKLMEDLQQIGLPLVIGQIIEKYSDGEFGIDFSEVTQYCVFHNRLLKYLNRSMETQYSDFLYSDERDGVFAYKLFQILEEGVLNILKNTVNLDNREKFEKDLYLQQLVTIYESFLNSERAKNSEQFQFHFKNHLITVKEISTSFLGIGSPEDLQTVSKELKQFYLNISKQTDRIEFTFAKKTVNFGNQLNQSDNQIIDQVNNYKQSYISAKEDINGSNQGSAIKNWIQNKKSNQMKTNNIDLPRQQNYFEYSNQRTNLNKSNLSQQEYANQSAPTSESKNSKNLISQQAAGLKEQYVKQQQQQQNLSQQEIFSRQDASLQDQFSRQQISQIDQYSKFSQQIPQQQSALSSIQYERNNIFSQKDSQSFIKENKVLNKNPFLSKYQQNDDEDFVRQETQ